MLGTSWVSTVQVVRESVYCMSLCRKVSKNVLISSFLDTMLELAERDLPAIMPTKRSAGVTPEMNLRNLSSVGHEACKL